VLDAFSGRNEKTEFTIAATVKDLHALTDKSLSEQRSLFGRCACPNQCVRTWRPPLPSARRGAQTAQKQYTGSLEVDAQPSAARIHPPEGAARKVSASVRRAHIPDTAAASGPRTGNLEGP
jgi:hypothetical protein